MSSSRVLFRIGIVACTGLVSMTVPDLGALIALFGSMSGSLLAIVTPAVINVRIRGAEISPLESALSIACVVFGAVGGLWGTGLALRLILSGQAEEGR